MKLTPRRAENAVAEILSAFSSPYGFSPVQRIPVIGRTGPDISINELGLVVDVKSRKEVPKSVFPPPGQVAAYPSHPPMLGALLRDLDLLFTQATVIQLSASKMVANWLDHMDQWRLEHYPEGISAVVLRRPGMAYLDSAFVIYASERTKLCKIN